MIKAFVDAWFENRDKVHAHFESRPPQGYRDIVQAVVGVLGDAKDMRGTPDPERIHEINDGGYQGTLVYVIGDTGYQPYRYWYVRVSYGSCSGCDALEAANDTDDYMTLALHIVQGLREMGDESV